jgi:hypothetical protein
MQHLKNVPGAPPAPVPTVPSALPNQPIASIADLSISDIFNSSLLSQPGGLGTLFPNFSTAGPPAHPSSPNLLHNGLRTAPPSPIRRYSIQGGFGV